MCLTFENATNRVASYKHVSKNDQKKFNNAYCTYVGKLSPAVSETTLVKMFSKYGKVLRVNVPQWVSKGRTRSRGFAVIEYAATASVDKSLILDGTTLEGKQIIVKRLTDVVNKEDKKLGKKKREESKKSVTKETEVDEAGQEDENNEEHSEHEEQPKGQVDEESSEEIQEFGKMDESD